MKTSFLRIVPPVLSAGLASLTVVPDTPARVFVATNSSWRYFKGTSEASTPTNAWRQLDFDDSGWLVGAAPFHFGTNAAGGDDKLVEGTILSDMRSNYTCLFLRQPFVLPDTNNVQGLWLNAWFDDGLAIWINGQPARNPLSVSGLGYTNTATTSREGSTRNALALSSAMGLLGPGTNVLCLQVFNRSLTDDDFRIDVELAETPSTFALATNAYPVQEAAAQMEVRVMRAGALDGGVTVDYATTNGTASAGLDYGAVAGTLLFEEGQTEHIIALRIFNDALIEGPEAFQLRLSNPSGRATLGSPSSATVQIADRINPGDPVSPVLLTSRELIDNYDDNHFTGRIEGRGSVIESNQQFNVLGSFPVPTRSMYDSYVITGYPTTWTVTNGATREWRADLISLDENATNTAILTVGSDTGAGYIFHMGRDFVFLLKWSPGGSYCFLSCERVALWNTNAILALALTYVHPNLVLTPRVLDKADPRKVLYANTVVDTPSADPTLTASQFQALTGIQLVDLATDTPGTPPTVAAVWLGVFQNTDGRQPVPKATFDNLELWTYRVPTARCVDASGANPAPPYATWASAAHTIQDAVDAALPGDEIVVTNGIYANGGRAVGTNLLVNRVAVDKPLTLRSVNGPQFTVIEGYHVPGTTNGDAAIRCVYLTNGASLSGFTLTKGATRTDGDYSSEQSGAGVWCESTNATVSNCVLARNSAYGGGGAFSGTLDNCALTGNSARDGGGAAFSTLNNCTLTANSAYFCGGAFLCTLYGSTLIGNSASSDGGGACGGTLNHCILIGNSADYGGGAADFFGESRLNNCTLIGNSARLGGGAAKSRLNNCIVYFNVATNGANFIQDENSPLNCCCTSPLPTNGVGNITSAPLFVDDAAGNLRLQANSPCINAGRNAYAPGPTDLDGNPRIISGTVDIGAYEFQGSGSVISYAWLQHYGLPTDGSADATDPDADGHNTWQEWRCQTDPTNALSVLRLLSASHDGTNVTVTWQSVAGVHYSLECSTNLSAIPRFTLVATNLPGQPGTTSFSDTNAAGLGPFFYRAGVGN